jgi:hypothetical protein
VIVDDGTRVICSLQTAGSSGDCSIKPGDRIRAEVSDLGIVTTMRALPPPEKEKDKFGKTTRELGLETLNIAPTGDYVVIPAPSGSLKANDPQAPVPVRAPDGKTLGTLHKLIMDSGTGQIAFAVVHLQDTNYLVAVPWGDLAVADDQGAVVLKTRGLQLEPPLSPKLAQDRSPKEQELYRIVQQLQEEIPADLRSQEHRRIDAQRRLESQLKKKQDEKHMAQVQKPTCPDPQQEKGDVVRGQVLDVADNFLIVKDTSGKRIHVYTNECTKRTSQRVRMSPFLPGDTIEAYITPKGQAISLSMLRPAAYASFPDN